MQVSEWFAYNDKTGAIAVCERRNGLRCGSIILTSAFSVFIERGGRATSNGAENKCRFQVSIWD